MASKSRDITLAAPSNVAFGLARAAGSELPGFRVSRDDPAGYYLKFARGFGWTNPTDIEVTVYQLDAQSSQLRLSANILALFDPFGFLDSTLDRFENHLRAHHQASLQGVRPPPPPRDRRVMWANIIIIGVMLAALGLIVLVAVLAALLGH